MRPIMNPIDSRILLEVQRTPRMSKCEICRSINGRERYYCGDKICFANPRKRAGVGSWASREIRPHNCESPLSTIRSAMRRLQEKGLILIRREKKPDGRNNRGWDWMKVSYSTGLLWFGGM